MESSAVDPWDQWWELAAAIQFLGYDVSKIGRLRQLEAMDLAIFARRGPRKGLRVLFVGTKEAILSDMSVLDLKQK